MGFSNTQSVVKFNEIEGGTLWREKKFRKKSHNTEKLTGGTFWVFNIHSVAKHEKIEENKNFYFRKKISQCRKKTERGDPLGFSNIQSVAKQQKNEGGPFGEKKFPEKKSRSAEKNWKGDPLVSPGMVWYAGKQKKPFWFSSLDQIVQFGAIIFCRTFKNYFGQFVWIEKKSL